MAWFKEYTDVADADESTKEILAARITAIAEADRAVAGRSSEISIARGGLVLAVIAAIVVVLLDVWMYVSFRQHVQTIPRLGDPGGSGFSDLWQLIASGFYYVCAYAICPLATLVAIGSLLSYAGDPNVGKKRGSIEA